MSVPKMSGKKAKEEKLARTAMAIRLAAVALSWTVCVQAAEPTGEQIYEQACKSCHESGESRAPSLDVLRQLSYAAILDSLRDGVMAYVGETLPDGHIEAVSLYLGKGTAELPSLTRQSCADPTWGDPLSGPRWIGWGADLENSRYQPPRFAGMTAADVPRLELRWAFGLPDAAHARGHPTVAGGMLFVGSRSGSLYALDAKSGCTVWEFEPRSEVRTAILISPPDGAGRTLLFFGDTKANIYGIDAATGTQVWRTKVDDHPAATLTGSPVLFEGTLYFGVSSIEEFTGAFAKYPCCSFRGSVQAVDAWNGERAWKTHTIPEEPVPQLANAAGVVQLGPAGAAIWSAPTIDAKLRRLYVTTGDNYSDPPTDDSDAIIAYSLDSGRRLWSRQFTEGDAYNMGCNSNADGVNCPQADGPDFDFGSSAILVELNNGKRALVAGQKSGMVHAIDPDQDGAILWQSRAGTGGKLGGIQYGSATDGRNVYVAVSDYRGPRPKSVGGLVAYRLADGEEIWNTPSTPCPSNRPQCSPAHSAAVTVIDGVVFSGSLDGHLRAYSTEDGSLLWDFDTVRDYDDTVNGVPAKGGALNGPGPVVVDGMLYVNSGYGQFGSMPGNVFLAFGISGELAE